MYAYQSLKIIIILQVILTGVSPARSFAGAKLATAEHDSYWHKQYNKLKLLHSLLSSSQAMRIANSNNKGAHDQLRLARMAYQDAQNSCKSKQPLPCEQNLSKGIKAITYALKGVSQDNSQLEETL